MMFGPAAADPHEKEAAGSCMALALNLGYDLYTRRSFMTPLTDVVLCSLCCGSQYSAGLVCRDHPAAGRGTPVTNEHTGGRETQPLPIELHFPFCFCCALYCAICDCALLRCSLFVVIICLFFKTIRDIHSL
jgi:hypothetical protein